MSCWICSPSSVSVGSTSGIRAGVWARTTDVPPVDSAASIIGFVATLLLPAAADYFGRKVTVGIGALVAGASDFVFVLGDVPSALLVVPHTLTSGGVSGIASILGATMLSELVPERRGTAIGLNTFFGAMLGTMVVPAIPETAPRVLSRRASGRHAWFPSTLGGPTLP